MTEAAERTAAAEAIVASKSPAGRQLRLTRAQNRSTTRLFGRPSVRTAATKRTAET